MPLEFKLPDVGEGLTEGELLAWLVKEGDQVREGQPLARVETDKAVVEIPAPRDGVVLKLLFAEGATIRVGEVFVILGDLGEQAAPGPPTGVGVVGELEEAPPEPSEPMVTPKRAVLATPVVRKLAKDLGVDLTQVKGSGPEGRILEADVQQATAPTPPPVHKVRKYDLYGYIEHVPFKGMRRTIARNVNRAFQSTVPVTAMDEADITELFALKQRQRQIAHNRGIHLTLLPFVIRAVIPALKAQPFLNATLDEQADEIILKKYYNIGIATDTPEGLMVPVIKNAGDKSILEMASEIQQLAAQARDRSIDIADLQGGTFTITNYGAVGGLWGTPIMNYPEVGILGVGRRQELPRWWQDQVQIRQILPLVLTFDHRVVDGGQAARFLRQVIAYLEEPALMLLGG